jgi:hypothetical protein
VTLILDAGALVAIERGSREVLALVKRERLANRAPRTNGGVVGQVWRGGRNRQVPVARLLAGCEVVPIDDELGRRAGVLLGATRSADVVDAAVVLLAEDGDEIVTSDVGDLRPLAAAAGLHVDLVPV